MSCWCGAGPCGPGCEYLRDAVPRDPALERHLVGIACRAAGLSGDAGLSDVAEARAWAGGIRADLDGLKEAREEFADARNYLTMGVTLIYPLVVAGEPEALDRYSMMMGALAGTVQAWHGSLRVPS